MTKSYRVLWLSAMAVATVGLLWVGIMSRSLLAIGLAMMSASGLGDVTPIAYRRSFRDALLLGGLALALAARYVLSS
jgi:hypothetical protein